MGNLAPLIRVDGTAGNDTFTGLDDRIYFGRGGDDVFTNNTPNVGSWFVGGEGNDTYHAGVSSYTLIQDLGGSPNDRYVDIPGVMTGASVMGAEIDGRHLFIGLSDGSGGVFIIDWRDPESRIETYELALSSTQTQTFSHAEFAAAVEQAPNYLGFVSLESLESLGFDPQLSDWLRNTVDDVAAVQDSPDPAPAVPDENELIELTADADTAYGNDGQDTIFGYGGDDEIYGNRGNDVIDGGSGNDRLFGGQNGGEPTADVNGLLKMQDGTETVSGGSGNDLIYGNFGRDILNGGADDDTLFGGQGDDDLDGGFGDDVLWGSRGDDNLTGGFGADTFFMNGGGTDRITDFDQIDGDRLAWIVTPDYEVVGNAAGLAVTWGDGNAVIIEGAAPEQFDTDWIL